MASELHKTIKDYKDLKEQIKIVTDNLKELRKVRDDLYSKHKFKEVTEYNKLITEQQIDYQLLTKQIDETAEVLTDKLGDSFEKIIDSTNIVRRELLEVTRRMNELRLAGEETSEEYITLQNRAIELGNTIRRTSTDISTGAMTIGGQMKQLGAAMLSLDFDTTIQRANTLTKSIGQVSWSTFTKGINSARVAFSNLGKTLLMNPIFLVTTAVIALGAAIYKLMKETGLLEIAMEKLGKVFEYTMMPLNLLIKGLKTLTDQLGLTNNAQKELAEQSLEQAKADETLTKNYVSNSNKRITQDILEQEQRLKSLKDRGLLTVEEERRIQTQINYDRKVLLNNNIKELESINRTAKEELNKFEQDNYKKLNKLSSEQQLEYIKLKNTVEQTSTDITIARRNVVLQEEKNKDILFGIFNDNKKKEEDDLKERQNNYKQFIEDRISASRRIEQLELDLIDDDYQREYEKLRTTTKNSLEDIKRDLNLNLDERKQLTDLYNDLFIKELEELDEKYKKLQEDKEKQIQIQKDREYKIELSHLDRIDKLRLDQLKREQEDLEKDTFNNKDKIIENIIKQEELISKAKINNLKNEIKEVEENETISNETRIKLLEELNNAIEELDNERLDIRSNIEKKMTDKIIEENKRQRQSLLNGISESISLSKGQFDSLFGDITSSITDQFDRINEIMDEEYENQTQKAMAFVGSALTMINSIIGSMSNELNRQLEIDVVSLNESYQERMDDIRHQLDSGLMSQEMFNNKQKQLQLQQQSEENKLRKESFEEDKKMKIASATISMLQGIVSAWSSSMQLGPIAGPILGASLSALITGIGMSNINAIKQQKFNSGSVGQTNTNMDSRIDAPMFTFQGKENKDNIHDFNEEEKEKTIIINNNISATDIQEVLDSNQEADTFSTLTSVE